MGPDSLELDGFRQFAIERVSETCISGLLESTFLQRSGYQTQAAEKIVYENLVLQKVRVDLQFEAGALTGLAVRCDSGAVPAYGSPLLHPAPHDHLTQVCGTRRPAWRGAVSILEPSWLPRFCPRWVVLPSWPRSTASTWSRTRPSSY